MMDLEARAQMTKKGPFIFEGIRYEEACFMARLVGRIYVLISLVRMQKASFVQTSLLCHALIG
jgi:hypothetical protein